jgi:hypothetical protein
MTKKTESRLRQLGIPASYVGVTALIVTIICSQLGVCD